MDHKQLQKTPIINSDKHFIMNSGKIEKIKLKKKYTQKQKQTNN